MRSPSSQLPSVFTKAIGVVPVRVLISTWTLEPFVAPFDQVHAPAVLLRKLVGPLALQLPRRCVLDRQILIVVLEGRLDTLPDFRERPHPDEAEIPGLLGMGLVLFGLDDAIGLDPFLGGGEGVPRDPPGRRANCGELVGKEVSRDGRNRPASFPQLGVVVSDGCWDYCSR